MTECSEIGCISQRNTRVRRKRKAMNDKLNLKSDKVYVNKIWFLFFTAVFCFYTISAVQYIVHFGILAYIFFLHLRKGSLCVKRTMLRQVLFVCGGYTLLVLWAILSRFWSYGVMEGSITLNGMIKILAVIFCLSLYIDSQRKLDSVLLAFVYALAVMSVLILITSPLSTYGTTDFGGITHQFRNTIANVVFFGLILVWYLSPYFRKYESRFLVVLFLVTGLCTGSRRGIIQLALLALLYTLTEKNLRRRVRILLAMLLGVLIAVILLAGIPYLRETYWTRLFSIFDMSVDVAGDSDISTVGRNLYRLVGLDMFKMRPFLGFGVDGFANFLSDHPYTYSEYYLNAVYSHCNYIELLADFGIPGFVFYYSMHVQMIKDAFRRYRSSKIARVILIIVGATLVLDYGGISYQSTFAIYMYALLLIGVNLTGKKNRQGIREEETNEDLYRDRI